MPGLQAVGDGGCPSVPALSPTSSLEEYLMLDLGPLRVQDDPLENLSCVVSVETPFTRKVPEARR